MEGSKRDLLERAAARLDRRLAGVSAGRWQVDGPWSHDGRGHTGMVTAGPDRASVVLGVPSLGTGRTSDHDLAYVAAMGPPVGRALVRWLQAAARRPDQAGACPWALAVAEAILATDGQQV